MQRQSAPPKGERITMDRRIRRRTGGSRFSWKPASFEAAKSEVDLAREKSTDKGAELARVMPHVIAWTGEHSKLGGLDCPAPSDDPDGTYRVGLDSKGQPEIQRLNASGDWEPVVL